MLVCCSALQAHKRANLHIISQKCKPKATFSANFPSSGPDAARRRPFAAPPAGSKRPLPKAGPCAPRPAGEPRRVPKTQGFHPAWESAVCPEIIRDNRKCAPFRLAGHGIGLPEGKPQQKKVRPLTRHRICPDYAEANKGACPPRQAGARSGLSGLSRDRQRRSSLLSGRTICSSYTGTNNGASPFLQPPAAPDFARVCAEAGTARRKRSMSASPCPPTCIRAKGRSGVSDSSPARRRPAPRSPAGAVPGSCLGPLFVPKCRTPRADPAAGKLSLA